MPDEAASLDIEQPAALLAWLRREGHVAPGVQPVMERLAGGVSNRTVRVRFPTGEAWVLKQALERLRVPTEWLSSPARVHREALGLRVLGGLLPPDTVPRFLLEDHRQHVLGMTAVPEPHANWKTLLLEGPPDLDLVGQAAALLAGLHREAARRVDSLEPLFRDRQFFESLRLDPYYGHAARQVPEAAGFLEELIAVTRTRRMTLVHGDYSPKNLLVQAGRLVLLDHEVIHWGDPAFDVGFFLTHLLSKGHFLLERRGTFGEAARRFWTGYVAGLDGAMGGPDLERRAVRHTLACLLARVVGRSPLEYLDAAARTRQQRAVLALLPTQPATLPGLIEHFFACLSSTS